MSFDVLNILKASYHVASVDSSFPTVTLYFMGNIAMMVKPVNYLLQQASVVSYCMYGSLLSEDCLK
jgi:hypothetical protein